MTSTRLRELATQFRKVKTSLAKKLSDEAGYAAFLEESGAPNFPRVVASQYTKSGNYAYLEEKDPVYAWLKEVSDAAWRYRDSNRGYDHVMYAPRDFYLGSVFSMARYAMDRIEKRQMKEDEYSALLRRDHEIVRWANSMYNMGAPNGINLLDNKGELLSYYKREP